jgi:hypothetical protein
MKKSQLIAIVATTLALTFSTAGVARSAEPGQAISLDDYLYQKVPAGMFYARDTLIGFNSGPNTYYGSTTTKGPDNVWSVVFQPCTADLKDYCVESVSWRKVGSSQWKAGSVTDWKPSATDAILAGTIYTELGETQYRESFIQPDTGLPRGGYAKVWNLNGATHAGGDDYIVSASVSYYKDVKNPQISQVFGISIKPVKLDLGAPKRLTAWPFSYGTTYEFPTDIELQAKVRMGKFKDSVGGWFNGRILDPFISQVDSTLTLAGTPTRVLAAHTGPISCENLKLSQFFAERCANKDPSLASQASVSVSTLSFSVEASTTPTSLYPNGSFAYFEPILKPIGFTSEWNALTWGVNGSGNCQMAQGEIALVSSNATLYSSSPPAWDPVEQTLAYQVGSLHLDHTGALHKGHFNLAVPKTFAKCLWGENILNAKATVSVTNADGTNNVATSVLAQDDQMIYFKVAGFTFSTPQIKVKLEIPKVEPTPTPTATIKPVPVQKTITCVKGKVMKKVKAVNPKCPSGYKKK